MWETFVDFDICHRIWFRMISNDFEKLNSVTLTYFWRSQFKNFYISETASASAKMHRTSFIDLNICQRLIPLRVLHLMTLTYFLRSTIFNCNLSETVSECEMTLKGILITRTNFGYIFTLLDLHIGRWKMQKNTSIKLRKKEIFEGGWGILEF